MRKVRGVSIDLENLRKILDYNPDTGIFRYRTRTNRKMAVGDIAGSINSRGYHMVGINFKAYPAHRLAWLYVYGEWPNKQIDHINNNKADNRIANLRLASEAQNKQNRRKQKNNKSGFKGVYFERYKWRARIRANGKVHHLGYYDSLTEAAFVYYEAAQQLHGEFANAGGNE